MAKAVGLAPACLAVTPSYGSTGNWVPRPSRRRSRVRQRVFPGLSARAGHLVADGMDGEGDEVEHQQHVGQAFLAVSEVVFKVVSVVLEFVEGFVFDFPLASCALDQLLEVFSRDRDGGDEVAFVGFASAAMDLPLFQLDALMVFVQGGKPGFLGGEDEVGILLLDNGQFIMNVHPRIDPFHLQNGCFPLLCPRSSGQILASYLSAASDRIFIRDIPFLPALPSAFYTSSAVHPNYVFQFSNLLNSCTIAEPISSVPARIVHLHDINQAYAVRYQLHVPQNARFCLPAHPAPGCAEAA